jgi:RNA polymerase sigma-70 factor (ECF subfamily)
MDRPPDSGPWQRWLDEHARRLLLFARQQCRRSSDAEDVLQDALVEAWGRAGGTEPPPPALVFATIRRRAIDRARSEDRRRLREEASGPAVDAWFDTSAADTETARLLEAAVKTLPPEQGEVLTLKVWGGLTFAEIAEVLEIPANTAASRYRYGLDALRIRMKDVLA